MLIGHTGHVNFDFNCCAVFTVCSFEKGFHRQNHSSSGSPHPVKQFPPVKFLIPQLVGYPPPPTLTTIWKAPYIYHISYIQGEIQNFFWGGGRAIVVRRSDHN